MKTITTNLSNWGATRAAADLLTILASTVGATLARVPAIGLTSEGAIGFEFEEDEPRLAVRVSSMERLWRCAMETRVRPDGPTSKRRLRSPATVMGILLRTFYGEFDGLDANRKPDGWDRPATTTPVEFAPKGLSDVLSLHLATCHHCERAGKRAQAAWREAWGRLGLGPSETGEWLEVGGCSSETVARLRAAGFTPRIVWGLFPELGELGCPPPRGLILDLAQWLAAGFTLAEIEAQNGYLDPSIHLPIAAELRRRETSAGKVDDPFDYEEEETSVLDFLEASALRGPDNTGAGFPMNLAERLTCLEERGLLPAPRL